MHLLFLCLLIFRKRAKYLIKPQGRQTFIIVPATGHSLTCSFSHIQQYKGKQNLEDLQSCRSPNFWLPFFSLICMNNISLPPSTMDDTKPLNPRSIMLLQILMNPFLRHRTSSPLCLPQNPVAINFNI